VLHLLYTMALGTPQGRLHAVRSLADVSSYDKVYATEVATTSGPGGRPIGRLAVEVMQTEGIEAMAAAAHLIANMATHCNYVDDEVVESGGIPCLVQLLSGTNNVGHVQAARALANLMEHPPYIVMAREAGASDALENVLATGTPEAIEQAEDAKAILDA